MCKRDGCCLVCNHFCTISGFWLVTIHMCAYFDSDHHHHPISCFPTDNLLECMGCLQKTMRYESKKFAFFSTTLYNVSMENMRNLTDFCLENFNGTKNILEKKMI